MNKAIEKNLMPGEIVISEGVQPKTSIIGKSILIICVYISFAFILQSLFYPLVIVLVIYAAFHYTRKNNRLILTNKRLTITSGLFSKKSVELILNKIESIEIETAFLSRNAGKLVIRGTGKGKEVFVLDNPTEFRNKIYEAIEVFSKPTRS